MDYYISPTQSIWVLGHGLDSVLGTWDLRLELDNKSIQLTSGDRVIEVWKIPF